LTYVPPCTLLLLSSLVVIGIVLRIWREKSGNVDLLQHPVLFAIVGGFVFVYPQVVSRYASLTLNPQAVYEVIGALWISVLTGVVLAGIAIPELKPVAAFVGSLLPIPALNALRDRILNRPTAEDTSRANERAQMLEILGQDDNLCEQLSYVGIRSVRALADENPIRIFAEVDPDLVLCIDLVDRANLYQWIPDQTIRSAVAHLGYRGAVDLMTVLYEKLPSPDAPSDPPSYRFLELQEPLPAHLERPLTALASALGCPDVETVRNMLAMMAEDLQLSYLQNLWVRMNDGVESAFEVHDSLVRVKSGRRGEPLGALASAAPGRIDPAA
jgi:hypothetical protein